MKFNELSAEDQALVNTDFGSMDKVAEEQVKFASELYAQGQEMAYNTAMQIEKLAEEGEDSKEDKEEDEEEKKAATDYGNIIAEGFIDKLASLGQEVHGDPTHYFMPFVEEKVAEAGKITAVKKFKDMLTGMGSSVKGKASAAGAAVKGHASTAGSYVKGKAQAAGKATKDYHTSGAESLGNAFSGKLKNVNTGKRGVDSIKLNATERLKNLGSGAAKFAPHAAAAGGV